MRSFSMTRLSSAIPCTKAGRCVGVLWTTVFCVMVAGGALWIRSLNFSAENSYSASHVEKSAPAGTKEKPFIPGEDLFTLADLLDVLDDDEPESSFPQAPLDAKECTMARCFNFSRCTGAKFKLFVYPEDKFISPIYKSILSSLRVSGYATEDPSEACVFVLGFDTLDRDRLSDQFLPNLNERIRVDSLVQQYWDNGRNHIIYNLYSGTFPDYVEEDLGFDIGYAVLAKASMSSRRFRKGFDISLPLFHNTLPVRGDDPGRLSKSSRYPEVAKSYLLSFKGKRYLYGIGSDSRNRLYHIHNGEDIVILTTCRHGKQAKELRDERCDRDDSLYDKYDYQVLLDNTTFCLVPRGRRLGSFRFLESLQAGCIPVTLSNDYELPFSEVIEWNKAVVFADERLLSQIPALVRAIDFDQILAFRQQSQLLWRQYFCTIERIVLTSLEILRNRLSVVRRSKDLWNNWPALAMSHFTHIERSDFHPGFVTNVVNPRLYARQNITAFVTLTQKQNFGTTFVRLLKVLNRLGFVDKVVVFSPWKDATDSAIKGWSWIRLPVVTISSPLKGSTVKVVLKDHVKTEAVMLLQDDCASGWEEFEYGFHVWKSFPEKIVGYRSATHFWDDATETWKYTPKLTNEYSMVFLKEAFIHVQYYHLMWHYRSLVVPELADICDDVLMNFLVVRITRTPPARLTRKSDGENAENMDVRLAAARQMSSCTNELAHLFGYMPLVRSGVVYDPVLYKDNVSSYRKKYRQLESN